ncbi:MAG: type II toxin-antitoxin system RelE/ParE family toxin [Pseudomonadota bacterium]
MKTLSPKRKIQKTSRFTRDVKKLPTSVQEEAFSIAQQLADDVFHPELNVRHMTGFKGICRVVVMIEYRIIFSFDTETLYLLRIGHRKEIYRKLEL